jgi:hypothetical protein
VIEVSEGGSDRLVSPLIVGNIRRMRRRYALESRRNVLGSIHASAASWDGGPSVSVSSATHFGDIFFRAAQNA